MIQGPMVRKLICTKMSILMIPPGAKNPLGAGIVALSVPGNVGKVAREATAWVSAAIKVVKSAPDNPYKSDEEIAAAILTKIEDRQK